MRSFRVTVLAEVDIYVDAKDEKEAEEKAEELWYEQLKYNGEWDVEDVEEI